MLEQQQKEYKTSEATREKRRLYYAKKRAEKAAGVMPTKPRKKPVFAPCDPEEVSQLVPQFLGIYRQLRHAINARYSDQEATVLVDEMLRNQLVDDRTMCYMAYVFHNMAVELMEKSSTD